MIGFSFSIFQETLQLHLETCGIMKRWTFLLLRICRFSKVKIVDNDYSKKCRITGECYLIDSKVCIISQTKSWCVALTWERSTYTWSPNFWHLKDQALSPGQAPRIWVKLSQIDGGNSLVVPLDHIRSFGRQLSVFYYRTQVRSFTMQ